MFSGENFYTTVTAESARWAAYESGDAGLSRPPMDDLKDISTLAPIIEQSAILQTVVDLLDARDPYTAFHSERVALMTLRLCFAMRLPPMRIMLISSAAIVHDIGKMGIPDAILHKQGRLSEEEFGKIKEHTTIGANIFMKHKGLEPLCAGALHHHERWDGRGYPEGLSGEDIPYAARIIAVCDSIDAMLSDRVYRKALGPEKTYDEIRRNMGSAYDPEIAGTCLANWEYITGGAGRHIGAAPGAGGL